VLLWVVWLVVPEIHSGQWGAQPLARWDLEEEDGFWLRDPNQQWVIFPNVDRHAAEISGLGLTFAPSGGDLPLAVLWRSAGEETEHSTALAHPLSRSWTYVDLSGEPNWIGEIDVLGVRSLHDGPLQLSSVTLEVPGVWAGLTRAWRSFWVNEIFDESAVNFRDGSRILAIGFSAAAAVVVLAFLLVKLVQAAGARQLDWRSLCILAFGAWVVLDLRFTCDLVANARVDRDRYPSFGVADAVVSTDPYVPFAELVAAVERHVPASAKLAFLTDHWTYLIKSPYVFFPRQVIKRKKNLKRQADYIVVFLKDRASYLDRLQVLTVDGEKVVARRIAEVEDGGSIFEVIKPNRGGGRRAH
jgi:hypothetical protein